MGAVAGNVVTGTITSVAADYTIKGSSCGRFRRPCPDLTKHTVSVNQTLDYTRYGDSNYQQGQMIVNGVTYSVFFNHTGSLGISTPTRVPPPVGASFILYDDDDFNRNNTGNFDGDNGEDIPRPDTTLLQDSDNPTQNVFAPAYVRPVYDIGDNNNSVPFVANLATDDVPARRALFDFDSVGTEADAFFWTVYLLGAYQDLTVLDNDAANEDASYGLVDGINQQGACVFTEVIRSGEAVITSIVNPAATAAHEIGHLFNGLHGDSDAAGDAGLMAQSTTRTNTMFTGETINKIRSINHP